MTILQTEKKIAFAWARKTVAFNLPRWAWVLLMLGYPLAFWLG